MTLQILIYVKNITLKDTQEKTNIIKKSRLSTEIQNYLNTRLKFVKKLSIKFN